MMVSFEDVVEGKTRNGNLRTLQCQPPRLGPKGCSASDRKAALRDEGTRPDSQWRV